MSLFDGLRHRLYVLIRGERYSREVEREIRFHLDLSRLSSADCDIETREIEARRTFGNVTYYREEVRRMSPLMWFDGVRQDFGYAWRGIKRAPGFTIAVVATLGLGIGVNAAIFSFLDRVFAQPPQGVVAPSEIRRLYVDKARPDKRQAFDFFSFPYFAAYVAAVDSSIELAGFTEPDSSAIVTSDSRIPLRRSRVTGGYFRVLGVKPERGRFFMDAETRIETPTNVAVISDAFWRRVYNADENVLGRTIELSARPYTIIGVAAAPFTGVDINAVDVWLPANTYGGGGGSGEPWYTTFHSSFRIIARVRSAMSEAHLVTATITAHRAVHLRGFEYDSTATIKLGPIVRAVGPAEPTREVTISTRLAGVALMVLIIACANVANLLLVRASSRRREIALRRALGVSTRRLYEQLLTESLMLSFLGGTAGLTFAIWGGSALRHLLLPSTQWAQPAVDLRTMIFALAASILTGIVAGVAPAIHAMRPDLINSLKAGANDGAYRRSRLRSTLLVVQTALSVILIVGAGLFVRSLQNIQAIDLGYDIYNTLAVSPTFLVDEPPKEQVSASLAEIVDRLRHTNGVEAVALSSARPIGGYGFSPFFLPDRDSLPPLGKERGPSNISVSPGYFRAAGLPLIAGRDFDASDAPTSGGVLIVSQAMARLYWPGTSPIGKCVKLAKRDGPCSTVIGVAADAHRMELVEPTILQYYRPLSQAPAFGGPETIVIRTSESNRVRVAMFVSQELRRVFPRVALPMVRTVAQSLERQLRPWRLGAQLFTALGLLALCVAAIGVYSVVAYAVSQRTQELGVRIALGAQVRDIVSLVLGEGSRVVILGVVIGIAVAIAAGKLVSSLLYGVGARDPMILAGTAVVLVLVGLVASALPSWRASKVDPVIALRAD